MMPIEIGVVSRGFPIERELPHQTGIHQRMQRVVNRSPRSARMAFVEIPPQFFDRGMLRPGQQMLHDEEALRRSADTRLREGGFNPLRYIGFGFGSQLRLNSKNSIRLHELSIRREPALT